MSVTSAVNAVRGYGGVARTRALRRIGISQRALAAAVRQGQLIRPRKGVYAIPAVAAPIIEALSHCGVLACVSAARDYGLWTLDGGEREQIHTWVDPRHRPVRMAIDADPFSPGCCVFHRDAAISGPSLQRVGVVHCLVQLLHCQGEDAFFAALESALRQHLISVTDRARLRVAVRSMDRWLVDFARSDADSGLESLIRLRLHRLGIRLATQVAIPGVGVVDFVLGDCLILEADGKTHDRSRHNDLVRDAVAMSLGFSTLRFDSAVILYEWELVEAAVLAALARNLHRSVAGMTW